MSSFSATLHDRQRRTATAVQVLLRPPALVVKQSGAVPLEWEAAQITSARALDDGTIILEHGHFFLEVRDPDFRVALEDAFPRRRFFRRSFFDRIGTAGCLAALLLVLAPALAFYFWALPALADRAARRVSPELEQQIGEQWSRALLATYSVDSARTRVVQQFYDSLHFGGVYSMRVMVVKSPEMNAFAVPGGQIVIFDSLLRCLDAPEQLAGLLAHEASHVQLRHSTRAIFRELANSLFFSFLLGDYSSVSVAVARQADQLAGLSYSRQLELEADRHGLALLLKSGLPPRGLPDLFRRLQAEADQHGVTTAPGFLSTHPSLTERLEIIQESIERAGAVPDTMPKSLEAIWILDTRY